MVPVLKHPGMGKAAVETCARGQLNCVFRKCYGENAAGIEENQCRFMLKDLFNHVKIEYKIIEIIVLQCSLLNKLN